MGGFLSEILAQKGNMDNEFNSSSHINMRYNSAKLHSNKVANKLVVRYVKIIYILVGFSNDFGIISIYMLNGRLILKEIR